MSASLYEKNLVVICREVSKSTGEIAVYELNMPIDANLLARLRIRSAVNPELRYFVTYESIWDKNKNDIRTMLSHKTVSEWRLKQCYGTIEV